MSLEPIANGQWPTACSSAAPSPHLRLPLLRELLPPLYDPPPPYELRELPLPYELLPLLYELLPLLYELRELLPLLYELRELLLPPLLYEPRELLDDELRPTEEEDEELRELLERLYDDVLPLLREAP